MENELQHYGILGMKWGVRRYQNSDGSLTSAGRRRYDIASPQKPKKPLGTMSDGYDPEMKKLKNQLHGKTTVEKPDIGEVAKKGNGKKIAVGVATGTAVVAATVLTAYMVKKYGGKNVSEIASQAEIGKGVVEQILKEPSVASKPVLALPAPKLESKEVKQAVEKVIQSAPKPKVTASAPIHEIPNTYDFMTLMKQNNDLLEKMYANLA